MKQELMDKIFEKSVDLKKFGINGLAWSQTDAKSLISSIIDDDLGVLGGDVYKIDQNKLEPLYDNWSCEIEENESRKNYFYRSKIEALNYTENYSISPGEKIFFSIVFTEQF